MPRGDINTKGAPQGPHRVSIREALKLAGLTLAEVVSDSVAPACCSEGCETEPDGHCEHGNPSVLIALGVI